MKKHLKLFSLIALAIAGIGVSFAAVQKEYFDEPEVKETRAVTTFDGRPVSEGGEECFYFTIATGWKDNKSNLFPGNFKLKLIGGSKYNNDYYSIVSTIINTDHNAESITYKGLTIIKCKRLGASSFELYGNYNVMVFTYTNKSDSECAKFPDSDPNYKNFFIINSYENGGTNHTGAQTGFWTYFNEQEYEDDNGKSTLYFAPSYSWLSAYHGNEFCWPYIEMSNGETVLFRGGANYCSETSFVNANRLAEGSFSDSVAGSYIFVFRNIPLVTNINPSDDITIVIKCNQAYKYPNTVYKASITITDWCTTTGEVNKNFFVDEKSTGVTTATSDVLTGYEYNNDKSKAFIRGSFADNTNITSTISTTATSSAAGGVFIPDNASSFTYTGASSPSVITNLSINIGDSFVYSTYNYIKSTSESGKASSWAYDEGYTRKGYSSLNTNVTIIDNTITPSSVTDKNKYFESGTAFDGVVASLKFKKGGIVDLSITSGGALTVTFKNSSKSAPAGTADQPDTTIGKINDDIIDHTATFSDFVYNPASARYELYVAAIASDTYMYMAGESPTVKTASTIEQSSAGLITDGTGGDTGKLVIVSTGYYIIGWYPYNSTPSGTTGTKAYKYFIDQVTTYNESCATALAKRIIACQYCSLTKGEAGALKTLYGNLSEVPNRDTILSNFSYYDYDQLAYRGNGQSYDGLDRTNPVSAKVKYDHMQDIASKLPAGLGDIGEYSNLVDDKNTLIVMIIVISSTSLLAFSLVATMIVRKKKRLHK